MGREVHAALDALPVVGKAFKIIETYPTAVVQCLCDGQHVLVLVGAGNVVECPGCGKDYAIAFKPPVTLGIVRKQAPLVS